MGLPNTPCNSSRVRAHLGLGVEAAASIIQVDVAGAIQPGIFGGTQLIQTASRCKFRIGLPERASASVSAR